MKSRAVIINGVEDVAIIEEEFDENSLQPGDYLIETEVSLISAGTELSRVFGLKQGATYPVRPGYCSVGKVLKVGDPASKIKVGDRVLFSAPHRDVQIFNQAKSDGTTLFKLQDETDPKAATYITMCWIAMNGILPADVKLSDTVAVIGMGTLGLMTALYYKMMGVDVVAIEPVASRAEIARKLGIETIDAPVESQLEEAMNYSNKRGFDIVVDASGLSSCCALAVNIAAKYGQVLLMGSPRVSEKGDLTDVFSPIHMKMLTVIGALNRRYNYSEVQGTKLYIEKSLKYIEKRINDKTIDTNLFISHIIKPEADALLEAYRGLMHDKQNYTGVIIDWRKD